MNRSRRLFMANTAGTVAVVLAGCGGSDYSAPAPAQVAVPPPPPPAAPPPAGLASCGATAISGNHGHVLSIPVDDADSTVDMVYSIVGAADHNHLVTLTAANFAQIKSKNPVTIISSPGGDGHIHSVTVNCA